MDKVTKEKPIKIIEGLGHYTRSNSEFVLIGRKGKSLERKSKGISQIIIAPRGLKNSQKPIEVIKRINELYGLEVLKIELFARKCSQGWNATGLEYDKKKIQNFLKEGVQ